MPLPRAKDDGSNGAPVLDLMAAHVRLVNVTEHTTPRVVERKSDGTQFELDPGFEVTVEVVDDGEDGSANGAKFFDSFKYKKDQSGTWHNKENSKLGQLTKAIHPDYYEDTSIPDLEESDVEGFELRARVKPKRNPNSGAVRGSLSGD